MKQFLKLLQWTLNAAVFFTLFAFALNNQHEAKVYFFFGTQWRSPMVLIVLAAFALGMVVGVLGMVPRWWRQGKRPNRPKIAQPPLQVPNRRKPHMELDLIWILVGLPAAFGLGWLASRLDLRQLRIDNRQALGPISKVEFFIERATRQGH
jgi:uncharacterized integral membrane protein